MPRSNLASSLTGAGTVTSRASGTVGNAGVSLNTAAAPKVEPTLGSRPVAAALMMSAGSPSSVDASPPPSTSRIELNVNDDNLKPADGKGISDQRPEIVAVF